MENNSIQSQIINRYDILNDNTRDIILINSDIREANKLKGNTNGIHKMNENRATMLNKNTKKNVSFKGGTPLSSTNTVRSNSEQDNANKSLLLKVISPVVLLTAK